MELSKQIINGTTTKVEGVVEKQKGDVVVEFIQKVYSGYNKWHNQTVLTDMFIKRYVMKDEVKEKDPYGSDLKQYIKDTYGDKDVDLEKVVSDMSKQSNYITISLPTSKYALSSASSKVFHNIHLPLIVNIDGKDVSSMFWDFDMFDQKCVDVAYKALVKGEMPNANNNLVNYSDIEKLHAKLLSDRELAE